MPEPRRRAFLWQNGSRQDLGVLPGHNASSALAINDEGQVVGWSGRPNGSLSTAFLWQNGIMQNLGFLPGDNSSRAVSINNAGQVVGISGTDLSNTITGYEHSTLSEPDAASDPDVSSRIHARPFLWQNGSMLDLNALLPTDSEWEIIDVADINNRGWIAGTGLRDGRTHAILLEPVSPLQQ